VILAPNRKVADNLLFIDGYPYARGGPPVHILDGTGTRVVDPGAGRFLDQRVEGLLLDADDEVLRASCRGRFRIVHGVAANGNVQSEPPIALVGHARDRRSPCRRDPNRNLSERRLAFADLMQRLCFRPQEGRPRSGFPLLTELVDFLADAPPDPDPLTTTHERLKALHRFVIFSRALKCRFRSARADIRACRGRKRIRPLWRSRARNLDRIADETIAELPAHCNRLTEVEFRTDQKSSKSHRAANFLRFHPMGVMLSTTILEFLRTILR